jgi:adenine-specific DNA glycosylase
MELGATICTPRRPRCENCPIQSLCGAYAEATLAKASDKPLYVERYPVKDMSRKVKVRNEVVLCTVVRRKEATNITDTAAAYLYLLIQRPAKGLLGGLWEVPSVVLSSDDAKKHDSDEAHKMLMDNALRKLLPDVHCSKAEANVVRQNAGAANHVFSHIKQTLLVEVLTSSSTSTDVAGATSDGIPFRWLSEREVFESAIATQMKKVLKLAFDSDHPCLPSKVAAIGAGRRRSANTETASSDKRPDTRKRLRRSTS